MTLQDAYSRAEAFLASRGIEDAAVDAWYLLEYATGISRAAFLADRDKCMSEEQRDAYAALVDRRGAHIPLQHLTGEQEFMGLPFLVNEHVLIPRQDTETLVELALETLERTAAVPTEYEPDILQKGAEKGLIQEPVQNNARELRILDLCTGSGCIAVSLAKLWEQHYSKPSWQPRQEMQTDRSSSQPRQEMQTDRSSSQPQQEMQTDRSSCQPQQEIRTDGNSRLSRQERRSGQTTAVKLRVIASDISEEALRAARENARRLQADVQFVRSDLFSAFRADASSSMRDMDAAEEVGDHAVKNRFHMIVSNPPYIRSSVIEELSEEVRAHEPRMALDGGEDGLDFYRKIIRESRDYLLPGGWLLLEIGFDQGEAVSELMRQNGFSKIQVTKDLPGLDRVVSGQIAP
ncbi:MAG: peptide chain release factor N(5)-glutamine methyltransferase [Lachnospiraceae bacterium]|nr:peptide chain release factor N(5)-glutamine methyltransferase [Lachnospiraceae bacterium]